MEPVEQWHAWWAAAAAATPHHLLLAGADLPAAGVTRQRARTLIRRGSWTLAGHGHLAAVDVRDGDPYLVARRRHALSCMSAARRRPGHVVSGRSAAVLHGLPTLRTPGRPELTAPGSPDAGRRRAPHVRAAGLPDAEITSWLGVPVTTVARTLVDLGRHDRRDAIIAADAALAVSLLDASAIAAALRTARGWPGVRRARDVLALADRRAESALESLTRLALHDDGFPLPELQVWIPGTSYRVDLFWRAHRLILEADGLAKYTGTELRREKRRELQLRALGYRVERVGWSDVVHEWPRTRSWLRAALQLPGRTG